MSTLEGKTLLQRYKVLERKDKDSNAVTYLVHDLRTGSLALMKLLSPSALLDPESKARFDRECELLQRITSPRVVGYIRHGEAQDTKFLLMQYVSGRNVGDYIDVTGKLPPNIALGITCQAADGIAALHEANILHRTISPNTILIMPKGTVVLVDCVTIKAVGGTDITRPGFGLSMGSLAHMAPEVIEGKPEKRSDVYSLGATLFHMLTGKPPFASKNLGELGLLILKQKPQRLSSSVDYSLPEVEEFLVKCLSKNLADRPSSIEKFQEEVNNFRTVSSASEDEIRDTMMGLPTESVQGYLLHEGSGTRFNLVGNGLTVGRHKERDIDLSSIDLQRVVHRKHARFERKDSEWIIVPEPNARNGVWVNDKRIYSGEICSLHKGDIIHFAAVALRFVS